MMPAIITRCIFTTYYAHPNVMVINYKGVFFLLQNKNRVLILYLIFSLAFFALIIRLFQIQVIDGAKYSEQAVAQRQKTVNYIQVPRGTIFDRNMRPLTNVEEQPCVVVFPGMVKDVKGTSEFLADLLNIPSKSIIGKIKTPVSSNASESTVKEPFILKTGLTSEETELIDEADLPGVYILPLIPRYQPNWPAVHILGSVGRINKEEYQEMCFLGKNYHINDMIGKSGLEKQYEDYLRGGDTEKIAALVDVHGQHLSGSGFTVLSSEEAGEVSHHHVVSTIDLDYQDITEKALEGYNGAAVVMDVWNGNILALASSPKFDPDMLEEPITNDAYINKALKNYPPASVFKILIAAAALEEGLVKPEDLFTCTGGITLPTGQNVSCWNKAGHGEITFTQALANSCNPVFIETGLKLGGEKIIAYAEKFGLNNDTVIGYDLPKTQHIHFNFNVPGDIANVSIGENGISQSPVLIAKLLSEIANGGFRITPRLVLKIQNEAGKDVKEFSSIAGNRILKPETVSALKDMLNLAVKEGTGRSAQVSGMETAGKTGSSEIGGVWFAGFAPVDIPRWAVVVFIQKGTSGGKEAAAAFQKIVAGLAQAEGIF
jgi:penicillin-binding protein 2